MGRKDAASSERTPLTTAGGANNGSGLKYSSPSVNDGANGASRREPINRSDSGTPSRKELWAFKGWGEYNRRVEVPPGRLEAIQAALDKRHASHPMLGQWPATSICSNDILSSCFYTIGLVTSYSGKLAPLCLLLVGVVLYLFRGIYGEAITSYPMNGGSYNLLINTTSKPVAALGACLSIIAYIATGVVSAVTACDYLNGVWKSVNVVDSSCGLLLFFALIVLIGIKESAGVALVICVTHVATLLLIIFLGLTYAVANGFGDLQANLQQPVPDVYTGSTVIPGGLVTAILFGFAGGMLGVSGFETSSQFVESQKPGVFVKTLRNMWIGVTFFNPLISFLSLCVLPVDEVITYSSTVLARVARVVGDWMDMKMLPVGSSLIGPYLETWISIDAFIVLSGAVLTAYVGIDGLIYQLSQDGCLPQVLLTKNQWRGTNHYIILVYLVLASSQVLILDGDVDALAGVYSFAFLGVMTIFTVGVQLLKLKRATIPRDVVAPWWQVILAFILVVTALFANIKSKPQYLVYFASYFLAVGFVILIMFQRVRIVKLLLYFGPPFLIEPLRKQLQEIRKDEVVFFCKKPDLYVLNKAMLYVRNNETTVGSLLVVHCYDDEEAIQPEFTAAVQLIDKMYPSIKVSLVKVRAPFTPALVEHLSEVLRLPKNMMFITAPDANFRERLHKLGGLRIITH